MAKKLHGFIFIIIAILFIVYSYFFTTGNSWFQRGQQHYTRNVNNNTEHKHERELKYPQGNLVHRNAKTVSSLLSQVLSAVPSVKQLQNIMNNKLSHSRRAEVNISGNYGNVNAFAHLTAMTEKDINIRNIILKKKPTPSAIKYFSAALNSFNSSVNRVSLVQTKNNTLHNKKNKLRMKNLEMSELVGVHILQNGLMKYSNSLSCEPLFPAVFLYNRIFKTGSTSVSSYLKMTTYNTSIVLKEGTTEDWYKTGDPYPYPQNIVKYAHLSERLIYIAHFFFRSKMKIMKPHTYINILRDPVDRIISHYNYMRNEKLRPKHRIKELKRSGQWKESLAECIKQQHRGCEDNVMTRFLCGTPSYCKTGSEKALKRAKYNMRTFYGAIGTLENIQVFLKILRKRFPTIFTAEFPLMHDKQNSNNKTSSIDTKLHNIIEHRNQADIALYKYALLRQKAQVKACGL